MVSTLLNESLDNTFLQINDLGNKNEHYISSHKFNLFQQFFIIGLDPKIIYNLNEIELSSLPPHYLEPKIISKYPNTSLPYLYIPDSIIASHCFPNGLKNIIIKDIQKQPLKESNFVFSIDNQGYEDKESSLRTKRVYYTCYYFYESIEDYRKCINLRNKVKKENNDLNKNYYIPKVICFSSFSPYFKQTTIILKNLKKYVNKYNYKNCSLMNENLKNNNETNLIPIEKIIDGLIFNIPSIPRSKYVINLNNETFGLSSNSKETSSILDPKDKIQEPSSINGNNNEVVFKLSPPNRLPLPIINFSELMYFFQIDDIFEIIKWIILEVPILFFCDNIKDLTYTIEGLISLIYPFEYSYPVISVLPEKSYPMIAIMKHFIFGINYKYNKDIFIQKGINIQNHNLLVIVRIEKRFNEIINFREKGNLNYSAITVLKSDKNRPVLKLDQLNSYYNKNNQEENKKIEEGYSKKQKITLPISHRDKLKKRFIDNVDLRAKEICFNKKKKKLSNDEYNRIISGELCDIMFNFFLSILLHYQEFCFKLPKKQNNGEKTANKNPFYKYYEKDDVLEQKYNENKVVIEDIFNVDDFLNTIPQLDKYFYSFFLSTKLFYNFMMKKIFPISVQDKLDILFFDEKINEKQARDSGNKKYTSPFLKNEFNNLKENIFLGTFRKPITQDYTEFLLSPQNQKRALNYFQYITKIENKNVIKDEDGNINDDELDDVSFYYFVFPKLLIDDIFYKEEYTIEKFWAPERNIFTSSNSNCIFNHFEKECQLIVNNPEMTKKYYDYNYSLDLVSTFNVRMKDYIHLLWLQYFAKTFHYTPLSERKIQFEQMMTVLKTIQIVDQNTYNILFWTINRYGDRNMNQELFINLRNKSYVLFLALKEKTKQQNNFIRYDNMKLSEEEKNEKLKNKSKMLFEENAVCENTLCNEPYNVQMKFLFNESISLKDNFVKFKCDKCQIEQYIWVKSIYDNGLGKGININYRLISPYALLKRKWFQDQLDLNMSYVSKEHIEPYMSAMFYFYLQGIYCEFMIPPRKKNIQYTIEQNDICYLEKNKGKDKNMNEISITNVIYDKNNNNKEKKIEFGKKEEVKEANIKYEKKVVKKEIKKTLSLNKSVSQNYLKTLNKKKEINKNYISLNRQNSKNDVKYMNSINFERNENDLDISGDNKGLFEYRGNSQTKKNPFKKKTHIISLKSNMLAKNQSGLNNTRNNKSLLSGQNSYEFFEIKKK